MSDLISRQATLDAIEKYDFSFPEYMERFVTELRDAMKEDLKDDIANLPSAQPDIIQCRNCKFASGDSRICMKFGHSPIGELDFCAWTERRIDDH